MGSSLIKAPVCTLMIGFLIVGEVCKAHAQDRNVQQSLEFEVAVVKRNVSSGNVFGGCHQPGTQLVSPGTCVFRNATLQDIIATAYGFPGPLSRRNFLSGEPSWVDSERYDIEAKAPAESNADDDLLAMLRTLLATEFKLVAHETTKEASGYGLRTAKGGTKMKPGDGLTRSGMGSASPNTINANNVTMAALTMRLSRILGAPVSDLTGLTGNYTFRLSFSSDLNDASGPSLFTALQEQLGLKLESMPVPTRTLVVDRIERPRD